MTRLKNQSYVDKHGVSWPHLTGTYDEISPVLDAFIINAFEQERVVVLDESSDSEEITPVQESPSLEENQSVTYQ